MPEPNTPQSPDAVLRIATLGDVRLWYGPSWTPPPDGGLLASGKPLGLLVYLSLAPRRTAQRDHLLDLLWADLTHDRARHALRQTVWHLRQLLGAGCITTTRRGDLTFAAPLRLDCLDFQDALEAGELEHAADLYRGDFLAGFAVPGGLGFEHWAEVERERLRAGFQRAAESLTRHYLEADRYREAQALARRARDACRTSQAAWRLLLASHEAAGDRLSLGMEASAFTMMLAGDGRELEPASRELLARTGGTPEEPAPAESPRLQAELVGREQAFGALLAAWVRAGRRDGTHLHLSGRAGLGKTRLLLEYQRRLRAQGATVVAVRANPGDRALPYALLAEVARALGQLPGAPGVSPSSAGALVSLAPALSGRFTVAPDPATGAEALRRRSSALEELVGTVSEERPLALLIDDLHWADPISCQALRALLDHLAELAVVVVTAARPLASLLISGEQSQVLELPPLDAGQVRELLASLGQLPDDEWNRTLPDRLRESADGSPLLVLETLQLALERGPLGLEGGRWAVQDGPALLALLHRGQALSRRIEQLGREGRRILLTLAVAGTPLRLDDISLMAGLGTVDLMPQLQLLEQRGLLRKSGAAWEPGHDEIGTLALELGTEVERREAHGRIGRALAAAAGGEREALARAAAHLCVAGDGPGLRQVWLRYIRQARRRGDERRLRFLAQEFLPAEPELVQQQLIRTMGRWNRVRQRVFTRSVGIAALVVAIVVPALAAVTHQPPPDMVLLIRDSVRARNERATRLELRAGTWQSGLPIDAAGAAVVSLLSSEAGITTMVTSPTGRNWLIERQVADTHLTSDIYLLDSLGRETPVVQGRHDDCFPAWSPDGTHFVFTNSGWIEPDGDNYDLAVYDLRSRTVRQLTHDKGRDYSPKYAPDGVRIAFMRLPDDRPREFCLISESGLQEPQCWPIPGYEVAEVVGWLDNNQALVMGFKDGVGVLFRMSVPTRTATPLVDHVQTAVLSPDAAWLALREIDPDTWEVQWSVGPAANPDARRPITGRPPDRGFGYASFAFADQRAPGWISRKPHRNLAPAYFARVRVVSSTRQLRLGTAHTLTVRGEGLGGQLLPVPSDRRWLTSDSSVLTVDDSGVVHTHAEGTATVTLRVASLFADSLTFDVRRVRDTFLMREDWTAPMTGTWLPFGAPRPRLSRGPGGVRAFLNNGDGSYPSGAFTGAHWALEGGLGAEAWISVRLTRGQWQAAELQWWGGADSAWLATIDDATTGVSPDWSRVCAARYPGAEGFGGDRRLSVSTTVNQMIEADPALGRGGWFRVRLQLFPDGSCGIALEGRPVWRSKRPLVFDKPFALALGSAAVEATVFHGPVEIWRGVRDDVQWDLLDNPDYKPDLRAVETHRVPGE